MTIIGISTFINTTKRDFTSSVPPQHGRFMEYAESRATLPTIRPATGAGMARDQPALERTRTMMSTPSAASPCGSAGNPVTRMSRASMSVNSPVSTL
jgi:hypothetical protein